MKLVPLIMLSLTLSSLSIDSWARPLFRNRGIPKPTEHNQQLVDQANLQVAGWHERTIEVGGVKRWFWVYVPQRLKNNAAVVMVLHGGTQSMRKIFYPQAGGTLAWLDIAEREGLILLVPNGTNLETGDAQGDQQNWNDLRAAVGGADDVGFIRQLINWGQQNYAIDRQRIYVTGASNGGMMTYRLLVEMPEYFAAGAAFIANLPESTALPRPALPTPLLIANGTLDPIVKWSGGQIAGRPDRLMSTPDSLAWWIKANRAAASPSRVETLPDLDPRDRCQITKTTYAPTTGGAPVLFYKMEGGGHAMPSANHQVANSRLQQRLIGPVCKDAEGANLAWNFMKNQSRSPKTTRQQSR